MTTSSKYAPYPGLRPFRRAEAAWFFGRSKQITALRDRLDRSRLVAVVGGSGVGKSSLVYAGLIPALEEEGNWHILEMLPRGAPRDALANALVGTLLRAGLVDKGEANSPPLVDHVRTTLRRSSFGLADLVSDWFGASGGRLLLLVDQFEEIFRFSPHGEGTLSTEDEAASFVGSLLAAATVGTAPIHVVLTMRADYIGDCIRFEGLPEAVSDGQYLVPRLAREEVESVIRQPLTRAGAQIDHDLVEQLLNDYANQIDALPVLQHVLMRLWDESPPLNGSRQLTLNTYRSLGRMREALSRDADSVIDELGATWLGTEAELVVAHLVRALTEVDHRGRGIRRPVPFGQLVDETGFEPQKIALAVDAMRSDGRSFLRPDFQVELTNDTVVDIGHEALIRLWRKIENPDVINSKGASIGWLRDEERDGRIYRTLLELAEDNSPLPPGLARSRLEWWRKSNRTESWAKRYGGNLERVSGLLDRSIAAAQALQQFDLPLAIESPSTQVEQVENEARAALERLRGRASEAELQVSKALVEQLRNQRDYELMGQLAEAVSRRDPKDSTNRRLYAQYLIDTGKASAAIELLQPLARRLAQSDPEWAEATGLLGRAWKQIYFDAGDKSEAFARNALKQAIAAYRQPFEAGGSPWHGVNLVALLERARATGLRPPAGLDGAAVARQVLATLDATPPDARDAWHLAMLAEASLGLRDWNDIEGRVRQYASARQTQAFHVAGTLRQFTQIWNLEADSRGRPLVDLLRARLMQLHGAELRLAPGELRRIGQQDAPPSYQLEAVLGPNGAQTYRWWKAGIERAAAVACVRDRMGARVGTGFLLRAGDLGLQPADELLVLTNFHVINPQGASPGLAPADAEIVFEAVNADQAYDVAEIVWHSTPDRHDAALLRLARPVAGIAPLPIAAALPVLEDSARVYIIGHPGGRDLAFSFQDNELLDHEGPPLGQPAIDGVTRLHYRAPTEGGSSGSPVFNSRLWQVIALHHAGGKIGMPKLNGKPGSYGANEGISMASIIAAIKAA